MSSAPRTPKAKGLQTRLILIPLLMSVGPLILLGALSIGMSRSLLQVQSNEAATQNLQMNQRFITTVMGEVESLIANISSLDSLKVLLNRPYREMSTYDRLAAQAQIGYILSGYINLKGLVSIDVITSDGGLFHVGDTLDQTFIRRDLVAQLTEKARQHQGSVFWTGVETNINSSSAFQKVLMAVKLILGKDPLKDPLLAVSFDPGVMNQGNEIGNSSYFALLDAQNRLVVHPDPRKWGTGADDRILAMIQRGDSSVILKVQDQDYEIRWISMPEEGWKLLHFSSQAMIQNSTLTIALAVLTALGIAAVVVLLLRRIITQRIVRPISQIIQGFETLKREGRGDQLTFLPEEGDDEVATLIQWYNAFLEAYENKRLAEEELRLKQEELKDLNHNLEERIESELAESRKKDSLLLQQSRQASMGEMIGNIAHQWRQPLNTMALLVQELQFVYEDGALTPERLKEFMNQIMEVIDRMSTTIDDFRDFFKPDKKPVDFTVESAVRSSLKFLDSALRNHNIQVDFESQDAGSIQGQPNEFSQVLLNILNNAKDILEEKNPRLKLIRIRTWTEGERHTLTLADTGGGIPQEIQGRIFDPYFTTKGPGKGTGIGLFMSKTIIERRMGGRLTVETVEVAQGFRGAEFRIEMPSASGDLG